MLEITGTCNCRFEVVLLVFSVNKLSFYCSNGHSMAVNIVRFSAQLLSILPAISLPVIQCSLLLSVSVLLPSSMDTCLSKQAILDAANLCLEVPKRSDGFMELIMRNHSVLVKYMASDKQFYSAFKVLCVKLANVSSLMYSFLASLELVSDARPTTFATIANLLFTTLSHKKEHQVMTPLLVKVMYITLLVGGFVPCVGGVEYVVESTNDHIMVSSDIRTEQYQELSEIFSLEPLFEQLKLVDKSLETIKSFMYFNRNHRDCYSIGNLNSNTDHLANMVKIIKSNNLTKIRLQHKEEGQHEYEVFLQNTGSKIECVVSSSLSHIQYLLARNTFRTCPTTSEDINLYRKAMISLFRNDNNKACVRHGRFPDRFVSVSFKLEQPQVEICSQICYFQRRNFLSAQEQKGFILTNLNVSNCDSWSFDIKTSTCSLIENISSKDFVDQIDFSEANNNLVFSGLSNCLVRNFYASVPRIFVNGKLEDLRNFCSFSKENLVFKKYNSRCKNLYYLLQKPLRHIAEDLKLFSRNFVRDNELKSSRQVRSLSISANAIVRSLAKAAMRSGVSLLQNIVEVGSNDGF